MVMVLNRGLSRAKMLKYLREQPRPECSPFDANGTITYGFRTLLERICNDRSPCCSSVTLYAKMGLHRYNLIQGKNYELDFVEKYHFRLSPVPSPYYITLVASDPSASLPQTFQTSINERQPSGFVLTCNIARIRRETNKYDGGQCYYPGTMPEWPTENPFENRKLFYVLNNSELEDNDWIRLYLELAVAKIGSSNKDPDLSNLKIVNVAMDTQDLNAKNATVYISYKDSCEARVGETNKYDGGSCYLEGTMMPEWPTENPFENGKLFYVLNHSELQDNDWIRLYLEVAVAKIGSSNKDPDLSNLKIVNVAMDTQDLNAKNATVYISYKDSCEARVGKDVNHVAMVRRTFGERTGCFSLMGKHQSLELIPKKGVNQTEPGVGKDVRSSFNEHTRCLSPMDRNLSSEKKCKDPQSEDDSCEAGVGKDVDRCLSPMGKNLTKEKKYKYQRVIRRLGVLKPWRFES